jgi:uncharacterized protein YciI
MWIVELAFSGEPERLAARGDHRKALTALHDQGVVAMAGPLDDDSGAVILFDVPDRSRLDELMAQDPYFTTTGVTVQHVRNWNPFLR